MHNKSFCVFPWIHAHVGANSDRLLCCVAKKGKDVPAEESLEEFWNGSYLRQVRTKMLNGEKLPECVHCYRWEKSSHLGESRRQSFTAQYSSLSEEIVDSTRDDGTTSMKPFYFDYRSKTCNFKCRTCGPHASSSIQNEFSRYPDIKALLSVDDDQENISKAVNPRFLETMEKELTENAKSKELRELYWAGGEPLLNPTHWKVMDLLVANGHSQKVTAVYNTNLSADNLLLKKWFSLLNNFKSVNFRLSVDGTGAIGEYIRSGLKYDQFLKNLNAVNSFAQARDFTVVLDITLTSLGLLDLSNLIHLSATNGIQARATPMNFLNHNSYMSAHFFPLKFQMELIEEGLETIKKYSLFDSENARLLSPLRRILLDMRKHPFSITEDNFEPSAPLQHMKMIDKIRDKNFEDLLMDRPELFKWFKQFSGSIQSIF